jgi:FtsK/SpoIIIE family
MNNITWGVVILIVLLLFKSKRRREQNGLSMTFLAYMVGKSKAKQGYEKPELTYDQIERKRQRNAIVVGLMLFAVVWVYGVLHNWGSGSVVIVYAGTLTIVICLIVRAWTDHRRNVVEPFYATLCHMRNGRWSPEDNHRRWLKIPRGASRTGIPSLVAWFLTSGSITIGRSSPLSEKEKNQGKQRKVRIVRIVPMGVQIWLRAHSEWADVVWPVGRSKVCVKLPKDMNANGEVLKNITQLVESRFPGQWILQSDTRKFRLNFVPTKPIPKFVALPDAWIRDAVKSKEFSVPIGMVDDKSWSFIELESETPHTLVAGATGSGKTVTITMLIAWVLLHGGIVDIFDPKRIGFADHRKGKIDLRNVPGVRIHTDPESWERVMREYRESMNRVYSDLEAGADIDDRHRYPTRLLVIDEKGAYTRAMKSHWRRKGGKGIPPAFDYEDDVLQQGRFARHFLVVGAQQANAYVLRSTDARFNYGAKIGAGPQDAMSWRMLFGGKRQSTPVLKGRGHWSNGAEPVPIQLVYITQEQVDRMAAIGDALRSSRSGADTVPVSTPETAQTGSVWASRDTGDTVPVPGETASSVPAQRDTEEVIIVGLEAAASFLDMSKDAFVAARKRNPIEGETKKGRQPAWNVVYLREWHSKRPRAGKRELEPTEVILSKRDEASGE